METSDDVEVVGATIAAISDGTQKACLAIGRQEVDILLNTSCKKSAAGLLRRYLRNLLGKHSGNTKFL